MAGKKVRVVVDMSGGIIQDVDCDDSGIEVDVVFLEDIDRDAQFVDTPIFEIESGRYVGRFVASHYDAVGDAALKNDFDDVFAAAGKRVAAHERAGRPEGHT